MAHESIAQTVLAEAQAEAAAPAAAEEATESSPIESTSDQVEVAEPEASAAEPEAGERRSLSWAEAVKRVPPDIAKLMKGMQGDYTRKTQELAEQRKDFKRERSALLEGRKRLKAPDDVPEYDPFNESTVQARIEAEVIKRLNEVLEPMEREYLIMQTEDAYQGFLKEHPDFEGDDVLRGEVQELLQGNESLDLETAYWAAKGRRTKLDQQHQQLGRRARRAADRQAALTGTATPRRAPPAATPTKRDLKKMSAGDIYRLAQDIHKNR